MQFENWIDRQIREAMERGEFDNLPGAGKPLELDSSEDWWIKAKIKAENLDAVLPGPLALRREVEGITDAVADCRSEAEVRERCEALNERIRDYYRRPETGRRIIVRLVDVDAVVAGWRQRGIG
ncbi:DUF1992 domain-containing protein [Propioniciclava sp. MC1595]|uniref:DnaJ family domain-containing protein n=1 Tax=Propioniciclava sp. MC1595 TaxID=2760308 RepID=UPI001662721F|nr:DUF1992 domain-containing protein [Propioniciclava sp. MC1595]MBB1494844.1 DUF1992 domain-containing protein [Propioniciclava sp. MC1595]